MARKRKPPRLYLRERKGREAQWVILDGSREVSTGVGLGCDQEAAQALERYLAEKYTAPITKRSNELTVADIISYYANERMPYTERPDAIAQSIPPLLEFWAGKKVSDIKGQSCRDYVQWRQKWSKASVATARHDLKNLRAAVRFYHAEHTLDALPVVTLPEKSPPRERWLTRGEVAKLVWASWRNPKARHLARFVLIGYYTGTRSTAVLKLRWLPSTEGGWFDLDAERLYRKPLNSHKGEKRQLHRETNKRQPPAKVHWKLLPHLRRWRDADMAKGISHVIHYSGKSVIKLRRSWDQARRAAGLANDDVVRHTLRHSAATWLMQAGVSIWDAAGYLGMSPETLERVYGHHHPDFQTAAAQAIPPKKRPGNTPLKVIKGGTK